MAEQKPDMAQQMMQQGQQMLQSGQDAIKKLQEKPTIEQVLHFLKDNRAKSFVLDIETDSTIMSGRERREAAPHRVRAGAGRAAAAAVADDRGRAEDGEVLRRNPEIRHCGRSAPAARSTARSMNWSS